MVQHMMSVGQDISQTRCGTMTDMRDGHCFLETHCILQERQQTTHQQGRSVSVRRQDPGNVPCVILLPLQRRLSFVFPRHMAAAVSRDHVVTARVPN